MLINGLKNLSEIFLKGLIYLSYSLFKNIMYLTFNKEIFSGCFITIKCYSKNFITLNI